MPELPEVETTVKSLNILKNKKVTNLDIHTKKLRYLIP
jgi:Formamidopyrimidine-DNA glycosylase